MKRCLILLFSCLMLLAHATQAREKCDTCSSGPMLWVSDGDPSVDRLPLKASHADILIDGPIARVTVTQRYGNAGQRAINARYVFPGSTRAAVHGLSMKIGARIIHAKIKEKEEAANIFAAAKQEGKRAALLNQQRPNVFMMDVANLLPGEDVELTLRYSELLVPEEGVYELVYPTVVGPRYGGDPLLAAKDTEWVANPYATSNKEGVNPAAIATGIKVRLESPLPVSDVQVLQHKIVTHWMNARQAEIELDPAEKEAGNRDFVLRFRLAKERIASGLMTWQQGGENYFLMMAQPPKRVTAAQIMKREYLFIVDVSGSMHGFPLDVARALMNELLANLKPHEYFNILFFSGGSSELAPEPLTATPENILRAQTMLSRMQGGGGTELLPALTRALAMPRVPDVARSVVVVTDGYVGVEREAYDMIRRNLNASNLFAFGIGRSVNRHLIEALAHAGSGEPFVVAAAEQAETIGARFRRMIQTPLMTNIRLEAEGAELYDMEPGEVPQLLAERPVVVFGKYRAATPGAALKISGTGAAGSYQARLPLAQAEARGKAELLPLLWARHRLMRLSDLRGSSAQEQHRAEIVRLGLDFGLLTQYTSFVAVDEVVANPQGNAENVQQALPLPQGVSTYALGRVPEPEFYWMLGLLAAMLGLSRQIRARRG